MTRELVICGASLPTVCTGEDPPEEIRERVNSVFTERIPGGYKVFDRIERYEYEEEDDAEVLDHHEDGTYEEMPAPICSEGYLIRGAIICMACYCSLMPLTPSGVALTHELSRAIRDARAMDPADLPRVG